VTERRNAGLPDAHLANDEATRRVLVEAIRDFAPRVVILPFPIGRHPDHRIASEVGRDACYLAGLARYPAAARRTSVQGALRALLPGGPGQAELRGGHQRPVRAEARRHQVLRQPVRRGDRRRGDLPHRQDLYSRVETQNAHYGSLIRARYGEPFFTHETVLVDDVVALGVQSM